MHCFFSSQHFTSVLLHLPQYLYAVFCDNQCTVLCVAKRLQRRTSQNFIGYCRAIYNFAPRAPNQISMREGDIIGIISKGGEGQGWWKGRNDTQVSTMLCVYIPRDIRLLCKILISSGSVSAVSRMLHQPSGTLYRHHCNNSLTLTHLNGS